MEETHTIDVVRMVDQLRETAVHEQQLKQRLLATRDEEEPLTAFCSGCREIGYELSEMEVICAGEEFHAAMKRSTNGRGENSPKLEGEDDFYELLFAGL